ncbi:MAG: hypothetical protein KAS38_05125, partial [Anaerolineales bacterium]|nr:hypothetical protein [Anaerolineales bacterium]
PGPDQLTLSTSTLPGSLSLIYTSPCDNSSGVMLCVWSLDGQILKAAGTYNILVSASDGSLTSETQTVTIVVLPEDASVAFDPNNPVSVPVATDGGNSGTFSLLVDVSETMPDQPADRAEAGDISTAVVEMSLVPVGPGSPATSTCDSGFVSGSSGYDTKLSVTCDFNNVEVNTYLVQVSIVGGYYTGAGEDVLMVYDPSLGFTTGGGWFYWPGTTDKTNFGYTMKYKMKGQKVKGNLLLIRHLADGSIYRVKSNALAGLALGDEGSWGWASFVGKATYLEPGWPDPIGNHQFLVYVEDIDEPGGGADRFWIQILDKNDNLVDLSIGDPAQTNAVTLLGGNLIVPHGGKDKGKP